MAYKKRYNKASLLKKEFRKEKFSDLILYLFNNTLLRKTKQEGISTSLIRMADRDLLNEINKIEKNEKNFYLSPEIILFCDFLPISELDKLKSNLIKLSLKYSTKSNILNISGIGKNIDRLEKSYKDVSWTRVVRLNIAGIRNKHTDYIENIEIFIIKFSISFLLIIVRVKPSTLFKNSFKKILNHEIDKKVILDFFSLREIFKSRILIRGLKYVSNNKQIVLNDIINDLSFQIDKSVLRIFNGLFTQEEESYPKIVILDYNGENSKNNFQKLHYLLNTNEDDFYKHSYFGTETDICIPLYKLNKTQYKSSFVLLKRTLKNYEDFYREFYTEIERTTRGIPYFWTLILLIDLFKNKIIELRNFTFHFADKKNPNYSNKKILNYKNSLNKYLLIIERIKKEFNDGLFKLLINDIDELNGKKIINRGGKREEFILKDDLVSYINESIEDVHIEIENYLKMFDRISQDIIIRINLRMQKIIISLSGIAILITVYITNKVDINKFISDLFNYIFKF